MGGARTTGGARVTTQLRLPAELHERLKDASDDYELSVNFLATRAIEEFLDRLLPSAEFRLTRPAGGEQS